MNNNITIINVKEDQKKGTLTILILTIETAEIRFRIIATTTNKENDHKKATIELISVPVPHIERQSTSLHIRKVEKIHEAIPKIRDPAHKVHIARKAPIHHPVGSEWQLNVIDVEIKDIEQQNVEQKIRRNQFWSKHKTATLSTQLTKPL